ncbi:MAG: redox-sensing transcriptional repressor Rex, partial [Marinilabiliales bacterium]
MTKLPFRTVERLSKYRRMLRQYEFLEEPHIFSHDLARIMQITPEQVRRDLMLIGVKGNDIRGYNVN